MPTTYPHHSLAAEIHGLTVGFNKRIALRNVSLEIPGPGITVLAGRSGSGKTTLLRAINRLNEVFDGYFYEGCVKLNLGNGLENIYPDCGTSPVRPVSEIRRLAGMVFQSPDVLPVGIFENVILPLRYVAGLSRREAREKAQEAIAATGLWPEVSDRLRSPAIRLSGGQQQRLCLARVLALNPAILLLDEPTASLDAASSASIEELLLKISAEKPLVVVSHNPRQAIRLAKRLVLMKNTRVEKIFDGSLPTPGDLEKMLESE